MPSLSLHARSSPCGKGIRQWILPPLQGLRRYADLPHQIRRWQSILTKPPPCTNLGVDDRRHHSPSFTRTKNASLHEPQSIASLMTTQKPAILPIQQKSRPAAKVTGTQSIQRAIDILHEIASCADTEGLRLSDLCSRTGLERPTAHRIVTCLEENQMLVRPPKSRSYQLGPAIYHLGLAATQHHSLSNTCAFALDSLAAETGNTVFLTIRNGNDSVTIDRRVGTFPIQALSLNVGARRPLGIGAGSLAILAALPDAEARTIIAENAGRFGPYTDLDGEGLNALVSQARIDGYVLNVGHVTAEITALGTPIRNAHGAPIGAISVAAIQSRMTAEHIRTCVQLISEHVRQLEKIISGEETKINKIPGRADDS